MKNFNMERNKIYDVDVNVTIQIGEYSGVFKTTLRTNFRGTQIFDEIISDPYLYDYEGVGRAKFEGSLDYGESYTVTLTNAEGKCREFELNVDDRNFEADIVKMEIVDYREIE